MICAWKPLLDMLPLWMHDFLDKQGKNSLQELRLRVNTPPILKLNDHVICMNRVVTDADLKACVNHVTKFSPWSTSTAPKCYYTATGGHRIGLCGSVVIANGQITGIRELTSLCIRVARDYPGIAQSLADIRGSVLIVGQPGSGKTTFLRDFIRQISNHRKESITVIDERQEIFPYYNNTFCFATGSFTDVLSCCDKESGIEAALRNTGPAIIALDEITAEADCKALLKAGWCGVDLIATAHAGSKQDLLTRPVYQPLIKGHLFDKLIIMHPDKTWHLEGMMQLC